MKDIARSTLLAGVGRYAQALSTTSPKELVGEEEVVTVVTAKAIPLCHDTIFTLKRL
jgi:hypothetical protein